MKTAPRIHRNLPKRALYFLTFSGVHQTKLSRNSRLRHAKTVLMRPKSMKKTKRVIMTLIGVWKILILSLSNNRKNTRLITAWN